VKNWGRAKLACIIKDRQSVYEFRSSSLMLVQLKRFFFQKLNI